MPIKKRPALGEAIPTTSFTPEGLDGDTDSPLHEYFEILDYLPPEVQKEARQAAIKQTVIGKEKREEVDGPTFWRGLTRKQVASFRCLVPANEPYNKKTMFLEDGVAWWKSTPENLQEFTDDLHLVLANEILGRGGIVPTRTLITKGPDGRDVTFRRTDAELGDASIRGVSDSSGTGALPPVESSPGPSRGRLRKDEAAAN